MQKNRKKVFEKGVEELYQNVKKEPHRNCIFITSSSTFLLGLASAGIMGMGGYFIMNNTMTYGEFVSFTLFLGFMIAPIVQMSNIGSQLTEAFAGLDRTQELMSIPEENDIKSRFLKLNKIDGNVTFKNISLVMTIKLKFSTDFL